MSGNIGIQIDFTTGNPVDDKYLFFSLFIFQNLLASSVSRKAAKKKKKKAAKEGAEAMASNNTDAVAAAES